MASTRNKFEEPSHRKRFDLLRVEYLEACARFKKTNSSEERRRLLKYMAEIMARFDAIGAEMQDAMRQKRRNLEAK